MVSVVGEIGFDFRGDGVCCRGDRVVLGGDGVYRGRR